MVNLVCVYSTFVVLVWLIGWPNRFYTRPSSIESRATWLFVTFLLSLAFSVILVGLITEWEKVSWFLISGVLSALVVVAYKGRVSATLPRFFGTDKYSLAGILLGFLVDLTVLCYIGAQLDQTTKKRLMSLGYRLWFPLGFVALCAVLYSISIIGCCSVISC